MQFFTNLGDIDEQGKTNDGVARVNLRANGRSGVATVTAVSGGDAVPGPSPSASAPPRHDGSGPRGGGRGNGLERRQPR